MAWLYKQKGSENWWLGYRLHGKQILRSTGTSDRKKAERELAKFQAIRAAHDAGSLTQEFFELLTGKTVPKHTLRGELDAWLAETEKTAKSRTLEKYRAVANEFAEFFNATATGPMLDEIQTDAVRDYLTQRLKRTSAASANHNRKCLRVFFARAVNNSRLKANPMAPIKPFKVNSADKVARRILTTAEVETIYRKCPDDFWRFMVVAGFYTGARMGDLVCLTWGTVDFQQNAWVYTSRKTNKRVTVPMATKLRELLLARWKAATSKRPTDHVWPEQAQHYLAKRAGPFSNEFYNILADCGMVPPRDHCHPAEKQGRGAKRDHAAVSFHCLRHTFVSLLKLTGGNQSIAKELAGHNSDIISDLYTHTPLDALSNAINQLPKIDTP